MALSVSLDILKKSSIPISQVRPVDEDMEMVTMSHMQIINLYDSYFLDDTADVERNKLFLPNYAVELSDSDFSEMMKEILCVVDKYQHKQSENASLRNMYFISAPKGEDHE